MEIAHLRRNSSVEQRIKTLISHLHQIIRMLLTHLLDNNNIHCDSTKPKPLYASSVAGYYLKHRIKNDYLTWLECSREEIVREVFELACEDKKEINNYIQNSLLGSEYQIASIIMDHYLSSFFIQCTLSLHQYLQAQEAKKQHDLTLQKELKSQQIISAHEKTLEALTDVNGVSENTLQHLIHQEAKKIVLKMQRENMLKNKKRSAYEKVKILNNKNHKYNPQTDHATYIQTPPHHITTKSILKEPSFAKK